MEIAVRTHDAQAVFGQLRGAPRPDQKRDIAPGLQQPCTKIAANGARSDHQNTHR
jgi:hypothetical protein